MRETEIFVPVLGYEDSYEVSNLGCVRSIDRVVTRSDGRAVRLLGRDKVCKFAKDGNLMVNLSSASIQTWLPVPRVVYEAFKGKQPKGTIFTFADKDNNNVSFSNLIPINVATRNRITYEDRGRVVCPQGYHKELWAFEQYCTNNVSLRRLQLATGLDRRYLKKQFLLLSQTK